MELVETSVVSIVILMTIGLGPALIFFRHSLVTALAIAPTLGIILTTIIGCYLIMFNLPIEKWAYPWLALASISSLLLTIFNAKKYSLCRQQLTFMLFGLFTLSLILLLPICLGGLSFTVFRGNGGDSYSYTMVANYLQNMPYKFALSLDSSSLEKINPNYIIVQPLLLSRWAVSMLLGWFAVILHIPPYKFEFIFTALFFIAAYGGIYALYSPLKMKKSFVLLLSVAVCAGFWAQLVIDLRAMSQISTIPIMILLLGVIQKIEKGEDVLLFNFGLGLIISALVLLYVEMVPLIILAMLLFFVMQLIHRQTSVAIIIKKYLLAVSITIAISYFLVYDHIFGFFVNQMHYAAAAKNTWHLAYFAWLYDHPLLGFWGLAFKTNNVIKISLIILATILTFTIIPLFFYNLYKKNTEVIIKLLSAFIIACLLEMIYLLTKDQLWAAGKALSFGYPFIILYLGYILHYLHNPTNLIKKLTKIAIIIFLLVQCWLGVLRIYKAAQPYRYFTQNISTHSEYKKHDWNVDNLNQAIIDNKIDTIGLILENEWAVRFLRLTFDNQVKIINLLDPIENKQGIPKYLILNKKHLKFKNFKVLAENNEFALIEANKNSAIQQISIDNFAYADTWLILNKNIALSNLYFNLIKYPILIIEGQVPNDKFPEGIYLTTKINNKVIANKFLPSGKFVWEFSLNKIASTKNLELVFNSNKKIITAKDPRDLAVTITSAIIAEKYRK